jgi:hypothetical protein
MHWLRDWFCGGRTLSARHRSTHRVRPALEALEDRRTPSVFGAVSSVYDNAGNSETFDVHNDGTLWYQVNGSPFAPVRDVSNGQLQSEHNVKSVSAGMNSSGLADAFVVHNDGSLTELQAAVQSDGTVKLQSTSLAGGVSKVVAEGNGTALVIDNQNFLWQFDLSPNDQWPMPVDSNGNPQFPGQPSTPLAANMSLLDANVSQATLLKDLNGTDTVIALHTDGTLWSDLAPQTNGSLQNTQIATGIASISSVIARGNQFQNFLYTVSSSGDLQKDMLIGNSWTTVQDIGGAASLGGSGSFKDVNVGWSSGDWVATTTSGQVFRDGQLMASGAASAFAGPGGSFYEVTQNGTLEQWSPQAHEIWVWIYKPPSLNWHGGWIKVPFWTNWTTVDSNVSGS